MLPHLYNGREKTFFFASFEGLQLVTPISQVLQVPDQDLRATAAPALQPILALFPEPDEDLGGGVGNYTVHASQPSSVYTGAIRIDHAITPHLQSFVRYTRSPSLTKPADGYSFQTDNTLVTNQSLTVGTTWSPSPRLANELRFNWSTTNSTTGYSPTLSGANLFSYLQRSQNDPFGSISEIEFELPNGDFGLRQGNGFSHAQQFNLVDTFSWTKGAHALKFGGDFRRLTSSLSAYTYSADTFFYSTDSVQSSVADELFLGSSIPTSPAFWNYGLFINDD